MDDQNRSIKDDFLLDPKVTFLNHGSFGAVPRPVFEAYQHWQLELEKQPVEFLGRRAVSLLHQSRTVLANYLKTEPDNLVYVTNATVGLNIVARSLQLSSGDEVLASNHEYGALDRTWQFLSAKSGFKYINHPLSLPVSSTDFVDDFWQGVTPHTRVIFLSHITSPTALIFPIQQICERARQAGILTIVDGAHAPGQVDLNLEALDVDFYSGNLHKWLCAPKGAGFLYAHPRVQSLIEPLVVSWGWHSEMPGSSQFVDYLEWQGTRDISAFLSVPDAIRYQSGSKWHGVRERCHAHALETQQRITRLTGIPPIHDAEDTWYKQMAASPLPPATDITQLKARMYDEYQVEVPLIEWNGLKLIRYSFQAYNSARDIDALITALETLLPQCTDPCA